MMFETGSTPSYTGAVTSGQTQPGSECGRVGERKRVPATPNKRSGGSCLSTAIYRRIFAWRNVVLTRQIARVTGSARADSRVALEFASLDELDNEPKDEHVERAHVASIVRSSTGDQHHLSAWHVLVRHSRLQELAGLRAADLCLTSWSAALSTRLRGRGTCARPRVRHVTIQRMDHVGVVVDDLEAAIAFFVELGMELDGGTTPVEGDWVDRVVGLDEVRVEIAFVRTPDGYGRLELTKFHNPTATTAEPNAPANTFGLRRIMFAIDDIDDVVARMRAHGAELVGEVAQYEDLYRLCYLRGPDGIIVALAEQLR